MSYQTSTKVKIAGAEYEIQYPDVGQQLKIENMKSVLSNGTYRQLGEINSATSNKLLDLVDAVSYFSVLLPGLSLVNNKKFTEIDLLLQKQLTKAFFKYNKFIIACDAEIAKLTLEDDPDEEDEKIDE